MNAKKVHHFRFVPGEIYLTSRRRGKGRVGRGETLPGEERGGNSCVFGMRLPSGEPMTEREEEEEEEDRG